jgi:hypothetical protein
VNCEGAIKKLWKGTPGGRRIKGRPRLRWMDVKLDMKYTDVKTRRTRTSDRIERASVVREAKSKI